VNDCGERLDRDGDAFGAGCSRARRGRAGARRVLRQRGDDGVAPAMLVGSLIAAVLTVGLIGFVSQLSRIKEIMLSCSISAM